MILSLFASLFPVKEDNTPTLPSTHLAKKLFTIRFCFSDIQFSTNQVSNLINEWSTVKILSKRLENGSNTRTILELYVARVLVIVKVYERNIELSAGDGHGRSGVSPSNAGTVRGCD